MYSFAETPAEESFVLHPHANTPICAETQICAKTQKIAVLPVVHVSFVSKEERCRWVNLVFGGNGRKDRTVGFRGFFSCRIEGCSVRGMVDKMNFPHDYEAERISKGQMSTRTCRSI